jgi:guanylate kinase
MADKRFTILSGPSCVGKGPLVAALKRFHPDVEYAPIPVIKSKESRPKGPRPEEKAVWDNSDYFRPKAEILALSGNPQYLVGECRGLPQAVDLNQVQKTEADLFFIEIYHTIGAELVKSTYLTDVDITTVFVAPIGRQEIEDLRSTDVDLAEYLTWIMLHKQMVRARYQRKPVDATLVKNARGRAEDAISELRSASGYSHVIVNNDGEGSTNWHRLPSGIFTAEPEGDAGRAVSTLLHILGGSEAAEAENWNGLSL